MLILKIHFGCLVQCVVPENIHTPSLSSFNEILSEKYNAHEFTLSLIYMYACAGASEPKNMAYMSRLGIWGPGTPFKEFNDFIQAVERR